MRSFRFLFSHKGYVSINLIGFAIGLAACMMMVSYLKYQAGFDTFHDKMDRIYRGVAVIQLGGKENTTIHMPGRLADVAIQEVSGVESVVRLNSSLRYEIVLDGKKYVDQKVYYTDPSFLDVFSFRLVYGNPEEALAAPYSIVLTKKLAIKLFGEKDPINLSLTINERTYQITGVLEDLPGDSHLTFDLLASLSTLTHPENNILDREGFTFPTYFLLKEGVDPVTVLPQLNEAFDRVVAVRYGSSGISGDLSLQPLSAIHTTQLQATDYAVTTPKSTLTLFLALAVFILLVAVVNFINLTTAVYEQRSREIGIKKVLGASQGQLFWQTTRESAIIVTVSLTLALLLCEGISGYISKTWGIPIPLFYRSGFGPVLLLAVGTVAIILISSAYPNWYLARMNPGVILKQESISRSSAFSLSKILVLVQYGLSVFIICLMLLFSAQLRYVAKADPGFDINRVLVYENLTDQLINSYPYVKSRLMELPVLESVTGSYCIPGKHRLSNSVVYRAGGSEDSGVLINVNRVQHDYIKTYGIHLSQGEDFSTLHTLDSSGFLINEEAARQLNLEDPVGAELILRGTRGKVIGVVSNYRTRPLYSAYDKEIITMQTSQFNFLSIRLREGSRDQARREIDRVLTDIDPGYQPVSFLVEDLYRDFYRREQNQVRLIFGGSLVGIILSVMGLIGLMVLTLQKQRKEIGIRKVFGASGTLVFFLLINRMIRWVLLSNLLAWPMAVLAAGGWLNRFAYRIDILKQWPLFLLAGGIVALITFLAISIQSLQASRFSPAGMFRKV